MKRVIIDLIEDKQDLDNLAKLMVETPRYSEVCNLFNERYFLKTVSKEDRFGSGYTGIFLIEIKDEDLYVDGNKYSTIFKFTEMYNIVGMTKSVPLQYRKIIMAVNSLVYNLMNKKEVRTSDKVYKVNLNSRPSKNSNKVIIKDYVYAKKENQGHSYQRSDKQWKVRGHYRNVRGTLCWVHGYEKQFNI